MDQASFLWMMYRCGYATKPGQGRVLAVELDRDGFEWALARSCLSHGAADKAAHPVRVQWDPERDAHHRALPYRSIQIGLSGEAVERYVGGWIRTITDVTEHVTGLHRALRRGEDLTARLPDERPYPLSRELESTLGITAARPPTAGPRRAPRTSAPQP